METAQTWLGMDMGIAVGLVLMIVLTAYALFGGADFGGGIWDLLAFGERRDLQRQAIAKAMGPVWEANHVWLIFLVVILFSVFPPAFAALSIAFFTPFHLVLIGIVLRGAAFVFRSNAQTSSPQWLAWAWVFGAASAITPFLLGTALGAVTSGGIRVVDGNVTVNPQLAWFSPTSLLLGALTLTLTAYLAAVYLTVETKGALQEDFRARARWADLASGVTALFLLPMAARLSPHIWEHIVHPTSIPAWVVAVLLAVTSYWALTRRQYLLARVLAAGEVVVLLWGWAFSQWPYVIYPDVTVQNSAVTGPAASFLLTSLPFGFALLLPSLWFLYSVFKGKETPQGH